MARIIPQDKKPVKNLMNAIESKDMSVVVQGAVASQTGEIIQKIRALFPLVEIILSTWEGQDTSGCDADRVVCSADPGCFVQNPKIQGDGFYNNVNRQIVSTRAGLQAASRRYALKTRTDIFINTGDWMRYFGRYDKASPPVFFNSRVLICNYYSRNPRVFALPFHWGDWVFFGETEDLKNVFSIPLMEGEDRDWFHTNKRDSNLFRDNINRYVPEQWILASFLRKHMPLAFDCFYDASMQNIITTEKFFAENTVILDADQWGIRFVKYNPNRYKEKATLLHARDWHLLYRRYIQNKKGMPWFLHLTRAFLWRVLYLHVRPLFMRGLAFLGVKEAVRKWLNRG